MILSALKKLLKTSLISLVVFAIVTISLRKFYFTDDWFKETIESNLEKAINGDIHIESVTVRINRLQLKGISISKNRLSLEIEKANIYPDITGFFKNHPVQYINVDRSVIILDKKTKKSIKIKKIIVKPDQANSGSVDASLITYKNITINNLKFRYTITDSEINLANIKSAISKGTINGELSINKQRSTITGIIYVSNLKNIYIGNFVDRLTIKSATINLKHFNLRAGNLRCKFKLKKIRLKSNPIINTVEHLLRTELTYMNTIEGNVTISKGKGTINAVMTSREAEAYIANGKFNTDGNIDIPVNINIHGVHFRIRLSGNIQSPYIVPEILPRIKPHTENIKKAMEKELIPDIINTIISNIKQKLLKQNNNLTNH